MFGPLSKLVTVVLNNVLLVISAVAPCDTQTPVAPVNDGSIALSCPSMLQTIWSAPALIVTLLLVQTSYRTRPVDNLFGYHTVQSVHQHSNP